MQVMTVEIHTNYDSEEDITLCSVKVREMTEVVLSRTFSLKGKVDKGYDVLAVAVGLQALNLVQAI